MADDKTVEHRLKQIYDRLGEITGPTGATGATGPQGEQGPTGPAGADGITDIRDAADYDNTVALSSTDTMVWNATNSKFTPGNPTLSNLEGIDVAGAVDGAPLVYSSSSGNWEDGVVDGQIVASELYIEEPQKNDIVQAFGNLLVVANNQTVDTGTSPTVDGGLSKLVFVCDTLTTSGTLTITGTSVDRNTGAETSSDTEEITVDALTTDAGASDANGNYKNDLTGAYISSKWWKGTVTLSTVDGDFRFDVFQCAFDQSNDVDNFTLTTFDITGYVDNTNADISAYLYTVDVDSATKKVTIQSIADIVLDATDFDANRWYRLRRGNLDTDLIGTTDGYFVNVAFGPGPATTYWNDVTLRVWCTLPGGAGLTATIPDELDDLDDVTITTGGVKGDILANDGTDFVDLTVGANDTFLIADSAQTAGIKWATRALDDLSDVAVSSAANSEILIHDGSDFINRKQVYTYNEQSNSTVAFVDFVNHTVDANRLVDGSTVRIFAWGRFTSVSAGVITIRVNWGSTTNIIGVSSAGGTMTDISWSIDMTVMQTSNSSRQDMARYRWYNNWIQSLAVWTSDTQDSTSDIALKLQGYVPNVADTVYMDGCIIEYKGDI